MSFHQLLAADANVSPALRDLFCAQTHTAPAVHLTPLEQITARITETLRFVESFDDLFDTSKVTESLEEAQQLAAQLEGWSAETLREIAMAKGGRV